jgi:DNA-binding transcriptional regulator YdaS (Cro superfamily)
MSPEALRLRMNKLGADVKDAAQIRQWAGNRRPDAANARYLDLATDGKVSRKDMRPDDYADIWPELAGPPKRTRVRRKHGEDAFDTNAPIEPAGK